MDDDRELEQLRARVTHLESLVERLTGTRSDARRGPEAHASTGVDRRRMLRHGLGLSAAAVAGVGVLDAVGSSAAAADGDAVTVGQTVSPTSVSSPPTRIVNPSTQDFSDVLFQIDNVTDGSLPLPGQTHIGIASSVAGSGSGWQRIAVLGQVDAGQGVAGTSQYGQGVVGTSVLDVGVDAASTSGSALRATSTSGAAVTASSGSGTGIVVTSDSDDAIHATSRSDIGIGIVGWGGGFGVVGNGTGDVDSVGVGATGKTGVLAGGTNVGVDTTSQTGIAVKATSTSGTGVQATSSSGAAIEAISASGHAVHATSGSTAAAVLGESTEGVGVTGTSETAVGVRAMSQGGVGLAATSAVGIGATFQGSTAAIRLIPLPTVGHPTTGAHQRGEIVLDHHGTLWVCTKAGTPGTWKQVAFA